MSNYQIKNSSEKAIKFTVIRKAKNDTDVEQYLKEDIILHPKEQREMSKLAGARVEFAAPVDFTFRQKKAIFEKIGLISKVVKEEKKNVKAAELPPLFTILKIKHVHTQ